MSDVATLEAGLRDDMRWLVAGAADAGMSVEEFVRAGLYLERRDQLDAASGYERLHLLESIATEARELIDDIRRWAREGIEEEQ
jgi:hypothetical protein